MKVPNLRRCTLRGELSLSRLQNEGSQHMRGVYEGHSKSIKATE